MMLFFLTSAFTFLSSFTLADHNTANATLTDLSQTIPLAVLKQPKMLEFIHQYEQPRKIEGLQRRAVKHRVVNLNPNDPLIEELFSFKRTCNRENVAASEEEAYTFGQMAQAAYCNAAAVKSWNCNGPCKHPSTAGMSEVNVEEIHGLRYMVSLNKQKGWLVVSIRGNLVNLLTKLQDPFGYPVKFWAIIRGRSGYLRVHNYFRELYEKSASALIQAIVKYKKSFPSFTQTLMLTGHSLGGAMAELLGLDLQSRGIFPASQIQIFTYGAPRVGDADYAAHLTNLGFKAVTRVTYNNDPIPMIPIPELGYVHHGKEMYLKGHYQVGLSEGKWNFSKLKQLQQPFLSAKVCNDKCTEEDLTCVQGKEPDWGLTSHIRAWDIVFGPWC